MLVLLLSTALAARNIYIDVVVHDDAGKPLATALIIPDGDEDRHLVDVQGRYSATQRIVDDDYRELQIGETWAAWVSAPGFAAKRVEAELTEQANHEVVALERLKEPRLGCLPDGKQPARDHRYLVQWATDELDRARLVAEGQTYTDRISCLRATLAVSYAHAWGELFQDRAEHIDDVAYQDRTYRNWAWARMHTEEWLQWNQEAGLPTTMAQRWCDMVHTIRCE